MYIEGVKNGQQFRRVLKETAKTKPVIVLKSGITESGATAAASHTSALSGSDEVWNGLLRQVNAVRVYSLEELIDMAVAFSYLPLPLGRKTGILGIGGGATVLATDDCASCQLVVPHFPEETRRRLSSLFKEKSGMVLNNPVDVSAEAWQSGYYNILNILANYDGIDFVIAHLPLALFPYPLSSHDKAWGLLADDIVKAHQELTKPIIAVIHLPSSDKDYSWMLEAQKELYEAGIPIYHSIGSAAKAVDRFLCYHEHRLARS